MSAFVDVAGWTLVHFLWQGTLIALAAFAALRVLSTASPHTRYLVACASLAGMLAAPVLTARILMASTSVAIHGAGQPAGAAAPMNQTPLPFDGAAREDREAMPRHPVRAGIEAFLPVAVAIWVTGVALLLIRLSGGWWRVQRRHHAALSITPSRWQSAGARLAERLGLNRSVFFVDSSIVHTPMVLGWLRPVILLPIAALANLTPGQVEALLAHELAHIRRHDYIVNLLQSVAETLLFYHPAVWWISSRIRAEREHCCDAVAVAVCGDPVGYAAALAELETSRSGSPALALAATGGSLLERVRRVLQVRTPDEWPASNALAAAAVIALLLVVAGGSRYVPALHARPVTPAFLAQVQPRIDWRRHETAHFDVLYTANTPVNLSDIEREAERAYERLWGDLGHDLSYRPVVVLFGTRRELEQSASADDPSQGRQRILFSLDRPANRLGGDLAHEVAHTFLLDILPRSVSAALPHWISEGLSEYQRGSWSAGDQTTLADFVRTNSVPRLSRLTPSSFSGDPRVNNALGHAAFDFIVDGWGTDGLRQFLFALGQRDAAGGLANALRTAFGSTMDDFDRGFEGYVRERLEGVSPPATIARFAASQQPNGTVYRIGDAGVSPPVPVKEVKATYPENEKKSRVQGKVTVEAVVLPDGTVGNTKVIEALHPALDEAAIQAVKQWLFRPGTKDGRPVPISVAIEMVFTLR